MTKHNFSVIKSPTTTETNEDVLLAQWYVSKAQTAKDRGIEFSLSLISFSNLYKAKKCYYTGLPLDKKTMTIDRIDNTKGYVKGNVVACHVSFNNLKSLIEDPQRKLTNSMVLKGLRKVIKQLGE